MKRIRLRPRHEIAEGLFGILIVVALIVAVYLVGATFGILAPGLVVVGIAFAYGLFSVFFTADAPPKDETGSR